MSERHGDYSADLVLDQESPLMADQLAWLDHALNPRGERSVGQAERAEAEEIGFDWLDRVQAHSLAPADIAGQLSNLAELCDLIHEHPEYVQPASGLRWLRDYLRALATEVGE